MLVLVTRPREQAAATSALLVAMGHEALIDPVLEIRRLPLPRRMSLADVAAIAITSANAVPALAGMPAGLPVFAVGAATAAAARAAGWNEVHAAAGDGADLARLMRQSLPSTAGVVLHLAGHNVREGLEAGLGGGRHPKRAGGGDQGKPPAAQAPPG